MTLISRVRKTSRGKKERPKCAHTYTGVLHDSICKIIQEELLNQRLLFRESMLMLLRGQHPVDIQEKSNMYLLLQSNIIFRDSLVEILNEMSTGRCLENPECLRVIADLIKHTLTHQFYGSGEEENYRMMYTILECSQNLYSHGVGAKRKLYLWSLINEHDMWKESKHWRECIIEIITLKIEEAKRRQLLKAPAQPVPAQVQEEVPEQPQGGAGKSFFKKGFSSLKSVFTSKQAQQNAQSQQEKQVELKYQQNLVFNELSRFVSHFINFGLPYASANKLLIQVCDQFALEQSRMHLLLTELISNQKLTSAMFTDRDKMIWSLERRSNRLKLYGLSHTMEILGITIRFIDDDRTLLKVLMLGKDYYDSLREPVYQQALMRSSQHRLKQKRQVLWIKILDIPHDREKLAEEYKIHRKRSEIQEFLPKVISDSIEVDVARSFNHMKDVTSQTLNNILKAYATVNKDNLDYCQGMNFIAGFLYMAMGQSEELAFAVMKEVISRFSMQELFNTSLPMLKLNFYQLDRLIAIILPDLHAHFKDESINSSYFSAPYFITLFTSTLQMQTDMQNSETLLRLWDYFIVHGWKAIFKVSLAILREFEEALLEMPFEVLLTQIVNLPGKFFLKDFVDEASERAQVQRFDQAYAGVRLPNMLLERLKQEFDKNYEVSKRTRSGSSDEGTKEKKPLIQSIFGMGYKQFPNK